MARNKIRGTEAGEQLPGTTVDDDIRGDDGDDTIDGGTGDDRLRGDRGDDSIFGGDGDDRLRGGKGDDTLDGGAGNDRLKGAYDDDLLTGGAGNDRFVFDLEGGTDTITDYTDGQDRLDFTNFGLNDDAAVLARAVQMGANVVFTMATGERMILQNTQLSSLDAGDILS